MAGDRGGRCQEPMIRLRHFFIRCLAGKCEVGHFAHGRDGLQPAGVGLGNWRSSRLFVPALTSRCVNAVSGHPRRAMGMVTQAHTLRQRL